MAKAEQAIVNSSPLIFLSKAGYLELLTLVADNIFIPSPVVMEINRRGATDTTVKALSQTRWLKEVSVDLNPMIQAWDLGIGETSVLSHALSATGTKTVIDDGLARKCAITHQIPVVGTLGIVLLAKKHGLIEKARPVMYELKQHGMYLKESTLNQALALVNE